VSSRRESRPAYQCYVGDTIADAQRLTLEEYGALRLLEAIAWRDHGVPADSRRLAIALGFKRAKENSTAAALWDAIKEGWELRGDRYVLPWMEKQRAEQEARSEQQRATANRRWAVNPAAPTTADAVADAAAPATADAVALPDTCLASASASSSASLAGFDNAATSADDALALLEKGVGFELFTHVTGGSELPRYLGKPYRRLLAVLCVAPGATEASVSEFVDVVADNWPKHAATDVQRVLEQFLNNAKHCTPRALRGFFENMERLSQTAADNARIYETIPPELRGLTYATPAPGARTTESE
jgi:uncharacterized protein YdaU (DUF1376 family)